MNGELSAGEFHEKINYKEDWGYPWAPYLAILIKAKEVGATVLAAENRISKDGTRPIALRTRDNTITRSIAKAKRQTPEGRFLVMYGYHHLAGTGSGHLKEKLTKAGFEPDMLIYPNSNGGYWRRLRATQDTDKAEVMRFSETDFFLYQGSVSRELSSLMHYLKETKSHSIYHMVVKPMLKTVDKFDSCDNSLANIF